MMKSYGLPLVLIANVISEVSGETVLLCNLVRASLLTNFEVVKDYGRKSLDIYVLPLISCALNMRTSILYEFG